MELDPKTQLTFERPFALPNESKTTLQLRNHRTDGLSMVFKIKTTAPKQYCVRPNSGIVQAGETKEISIMMQAMKEEPPADAKSKDKFLVQSYAIQASAESLDKWTKGDAADLWAEAETARKGDVESFKLVVIYGEPGAAAATSGGDSVKFSPMAAETASSRRRLHSPPPPRSTTPPAGSLSPSDAQKGEKNVSFEAQPEPIVAVPSMSAFGSAVGARATTGSTSTANAATSPVGSMAPGSAATSGKQDAKELRDEVKRLQELCDKYQRELMTSRAELRQRIVSSSKEDAAEGGATGSKGKKLAHPVAAEYSLTVVLLVALVGFLLGWLLF